MFRCFNVRAVQRFLSTKHVRDINRPYSIYEPEYLKYLVPEVPNYEQLNIQMKSYDFTVLEHYAKYVAKTATHMDIEVEDSWAVPGKAMKVQAYTPGTTVIDKEYQLTMYERNVQISNLPSTAAPILIQVLQSNLPEGVQLTIHPHQQEHDGERYIPDLELENLRSQLEEMKNPKKM